MNVPGPRLEVLTHRLAECPPEFLFPPGQIDVIAIVCDLLRAFGMDPSPNDVSPSLRPDQTPTSMNRLRLISVATWLLYDPWFLGRQTISSGIWPFLHAGLNDLAALVPVEGILKDPDRREELARLCLKHLGLRPDGETLEQATDLLNTLDSVERLRVLGKTRDAEARARRIREQMAKDAARAAAARYSPE